MNSLWQDVRFGFRILKKNPGYSLVAVVALTLGIGANAAIFSIVNAVMLRPLPFIDSQRTVILNTGDRAKGLDQAIGISPADFFDYQDRASSFEQLAAISGGGFSLTGVENPETFAAARVSTNFFEAINARPLFGRTFAPDDGRSGAPPTIVLSHRLWQNYFGADTSIVGRTLGDTGTIVIGVMPPDFKWPSYADCWTPLSRGSGEMYNRNNRYFGALGMLKEGIRFEQAQAELDTIAASLESSFPASNRNVGAKLQRYRDNLTRDVKTSFLVLLGAVGFVLLIACANVANLMMARAAGRQKEMAIRLAIGARRSSLVRQLLVESIMLSLAAGLLGTLLSLWGVEALVRLQPNSYSYLGLKDLAHVDGSVLGFTLGVSLLTGILFGLIPALQSSRPDLSQWLKQGGQGGDAAGHRRARNALVIAEIAMAMVLLSGAGLLIQSFLNLRRADLGFNPRNLASLSVDVSLRKASDPAGRVQFVREFLDRLKQTPGVEAVAATSAAAFPYLGFPFNIPSDPMPSDGDVLYDSVSWEYFETIGARLAAGRFFNDRDNFSSPGVAIINEALARQYFGGKDPIGQRISIRYLRDQPLEREIVGVVSDINQGQGGKIVPQIYMPYDQSPWLSAGLLVRTASSPESMKSDLQQAVWSVRKDQPVPKLQTVTDLLNNSMTEPRFYTVLLGLFAGLALLLASVGIYGVLSYSVSQRTREIGIRMALGSRQRDVMRLVLGEGMALATCGVAIGLAATMGLTRLMSGLLYGVSATDPRTLLLISVVLIGVALFACFLPARRATRVDPLTALKYE